MRSLNLHQRYTTISFASPTELKLELHENAVKAGISLSEYVQILVEKGLLFDSKVKELQTENENLKKQLAETANSFTAQPIEPAPAQIDVEKENALLQEISDLKESLCDHRKAISELKKLAFQKYIDENFAIYVIDEVAKGISQNTKGKTIETKQFLQIFDKLLNDLITAEQRRNFQTAKAKELLTEFEREVFKIEKNTILRKSYPFEELTDLCQIEPLQENGNNGNTQNENITDTALENTHKKENDNVKLLPPQQKLIITDIEPVRIEIENYLKQHRHEHTSKEEAILAKLYDMGYLYVTLKDLSDLNFYKEMFGPGFWGKKYGKFALKKKFSDTLYKIEKL